MQMTSVSRIILLSIVAIVVLAAIYPSYRYYLYFESHVSTDDAYVDGSVSLVSSRIPGTVNKLYVMENWGVGAGDLLLTLDPRDYAVRVAQAEAQLGRAKQSVDELYAQLQAAEAGVNLAGSQLRETQLDYNRAKALREQNVVSTQFFDQATTALRVAVADQALAEHQLQQARAALGGDIVDHVRYDRPIVQQAEAMLQAAKLDLSYTEVRSPITGIITRKNVHVGNRIQPGEPLMAIVPVDRLYVTANFKETQLTDVRVGQPADIRADIYPGFVYRGHVDSISVGTGAAFALLPPENATGNWVKVVQRVPVKVVLNEKQPPDRLLRMGLSVEVIVDITDKRGPLLSSTLQQMYQQHREIPWMTPENLQYQPRQSNPNPAIGQPVVRP
jgi:membrane fusion protein (multidrug efflux system)